MLPLISTICAFRVQFCLRFRLFMLSEFNFVLNLNHSCLPSSSLPSISVIYAFRVQFCLQSQPFVPSEFNFAFDFSYLCLQSSILSSISTIRAFREQFCLRPDAFMPSGNRISVQVCFQVYQLCLRAFQSPNKCSSLLLDLAILPLTAGETPNLHLIPVSNREIFSMYLAGGIKNRGFIESIPEA